MLAEWDGTTLTVWASTQAPAMLRTALATALGLDEAQVRVVVPDVGGGFGLKLHTLPEDLVVAAAARRLGRPVKWIEERREHLAAGSHAREGQTEAELALDAGGRILALRARVLSDAGAYHIYPFTQALEPLGTAAILPGPYRVEAYAWEAVAVATHKPPLGAYRGVGMTMAAFVMERLLDLGAERLGLDPVEIRRRNLLGPEAYPFAAAGGLTYDSGNLPAALERALELADWPALVRERQAARTAGRWVGLGIACYTEYTGMGAEVFRRRGMDEVPGAEAGTVRLEPDGTVTCRLSFPCQGQGHATAAAQLVADRLGVPLERVRLAPMDLAAAPAGSGTFGSRGAVALWGTVAAAAERMHERLRALAAQLLEAAPEDVVLADGRAAVRGAPHRAVTVAELARAGSTLPSARSASDPAGLEVTVRFDPPGATFSGAVHVAMVEVDPETGSVRVLRYAVVEDCGPLINPLLVEGQVHGAVCQGCGEALLERVAYDGQGALLTATLMDYALPRAGDLPEPRLDHVVTPARAMPGGVKGMAEGGTIGAPAAVANAVADAVRPRGCGIVRLPIRPEDLVDTGAWARQEAGREVRYR
jgi:carbon-monoxide dehydrogenase large subunit